MSIAEEARRIYCQIRYGVKKGRTELFYPLSGTLNKRTRMYKEVQGYWSDTEIDYELGIITEEECSIKK